MKLSSSGLRAALVALLGTFALLLTFGLTGFPTNSAPSEVLRAAVAPSGAQDMPQRRQMSTPQEVPSAPTAASLQRQSVDVVAGQEPTEKIVFKLDSQGRLELNETARLNVEKLFLLNEPPERARKQALVQASLPSGAARDFSELMARYDHYQAAMQLQLPTKGIHGRTEALAAFDQLRALRVQYFGPALAERLFGSEEAQQLALLQRLPIASGQN